MYEVIADGACRWRHPDLSEAMRVAKLLIKKSLALRVAIWPVPRYHTRPTKVYFHDRYFLMTTSTKTVYPVISYKNADAPHDIQLHPTPYEPPDGRVVWLVTQPDDLMRVPMPVLLAAYNLATGKAIKMFHTRVKGVSQTHAALRQWLSARSIPAEDSTMSAKKTTPAKKIAKKVSAKKRTGRPARYTPEQRITVLVKENPRRPSADSWRRFNLYKTGMTVAQALEAGLRLVDLRWDARAKFIAIA